MEKVIIGVTFFLGVALGILAIDALFTKRGEGKGKLKLPGIELSGWIRHIGLDLALPSSGRACSL